MRVTEQMLHDTALNSLTSNLAALQQISEQVSSTKRLNQPSDDPADVRSAIKLRDGLAELNQFVRNIDAASNRVSAIDTALSGAGDLVERAGELAVQGATATVSASDRQAIAAEVQQLTEALAQDAGAKLGDEYIFGGFQVGTPPYEVTGPGTVSAYQGDHGVILARIGSGSTVQVNQPGDEVFQPAFDALARLQSDLSSGNAVQQSTISALQGALQTIVTARAQAGARANRLDQAKASQTDLVNSGTSLLSQLEDVDMATAITDLTQRQTTYQATLQVNAKILQTSLLDYLR